MKKVYNGEKEYNDLRIRHGLELGSYNVVVCPICGELIASLEIQRHSSLDYINIETSTDKCPVCREMKSSYPKVYDWVLKVLTVNMRKQEYFLERVIKAFHEKE